jgi:hypothetical protein
METGVRLSLLRKWSLHLPPTVSRSPSRSLSGLGANENNVRESQDLCLPRSSGAVTIYQPTALARVSEGKTTVKLVYF